MSSVESGIEDMEDYKYDSIVWDTVQLSAYIAANEGSFNDTSNGHRRGIRSWISSLMKKVKEEGVFIVHMLGEMEPKLESSLTYAFNTVQNGIKVIYKEAKRKIVAFSRSKEFNCNNFVLALKDWKSLARRNHPECSSYRG
jgi:hypothetical protein